MVRTRRKARIIPGILVLAAALTVTCLLPAVPDRARSAAAEAGTSAVAAGASHASSRAADPLLLLVSSSHPLAADFTPTLARVNSAYYCSPDKDNRMDFRAAPYLEKMVAASRQDGCSVVLVSSYRSHAYQTENFARSVRRLMAEGRTQDAASAATAQSVAVPGTSEHETGLAVDVCSAGWFIHNTDLNASFDQTAAFQWLDSHAADYGFILRYPKGKSAVTGITYEPWHYRFVGPENARKIRDSGLCLEEYLARGGR